MKLERVERRKVMALAQARHIDAVLVTELSRWGRSTTDLLATLKELETRRVSLIALNGMAFDLATPHGDLIPIEQRAATEVTHSNGRQMTPHGVSIENPAFDVTPAKYITAIITERGVLTAPYNQSIKTMATQTEPELTAV